MLALNLTRNLLGLNPLLIDTQLVATARDHSKDMETLKFFAHESPVPGKKTPWIGPVASAPAPRARTSSWASTTAAPANLAWFHSPGHHKNMLGNHKRVGVGVQGVHFTEMFGR